MIPYPTELPLDEIKDVIATIRTSTYSTNSRQFAKSVWTLAGFALLRIEGEIQPIFGSTSTSLSNEQAADELERLVTTASEQPGGQLVASALPPLPWKRIASWALQILLGLVV